MTGRAPGGTRALSLVTTGLALALGLGLGAGPVAQRSLTDGDAARDRLQARTDRLQERVTTLRAQAETDAAVAAALSAPLVGDRLDGRTVAVVATPGAQRRDVRRVKSALTDAGATVLSTLTLTEVYVDPDQAQSPLEDLALRLVPPGVEFADGAGAIARVGTVLARALVQRPADGASPSPKVDQDAAEVIAGLDELGALRLAGDPGLRAELAVVVTGVDGADRPESEDALLGLLAALDAGSRGSVVAGPGDATEGPLRWVRDGSADGLTGVSSVDGVATTAGRVALVLALAEQVEPGQGAGRSGAYGTGRKADAVVPDLAPRVATGGPAGG